MKYKQTFERFCLDVMIATLNQNNSACVTSWHSSVNRQQYCEMQSIKCEQSIR